MTRYIYTHAVLQFDELDEMIDARYYCSDGCAKTDRDYEGWHGCEEIQVSLNPWHCPNCGDEL